MVKTISSDPGSAEEAFPWIAFEGRWGELQKAFFNGPTGPNLKRQWLEPIEWSESWRERSYAVPSGRAFAPTATGFFCEAVAHGSRGLVQLLRNPGAVLLAILVLLALFWFAVTRTTWRPSAPLRVARRRAWGQVLSAAGRMYVKRAPLFIGIGLLFIPLSIVISVLQALALGGAGLAGVDVTGESAGLLVLLVVAVGAGLTLLGLAFVQAATAYALVQIDEGVSVSPVRAYRVALRRTRPLLGGLALVAAAWIVLSTSVVLLPVAIWLAVRWCLFAQVVELEGRPAAGALRRSAELARGRWLWLASLVGVALGLALALGPFLGAILIILTDAPLLLLNVFAAVVYALAMPFVALSTSYAYFNARTHHELDRADEPAELPAESATGPLRGP